MKEKNEKKLVIKKDNQIVRNTMNKFNHKQNQILAVLLGKYVNTKKDTIEDSTISINEIINILGLTDGKKNYEVIKQEIDKFAMSSSVGVYDQPTNTYIWRPFFDEIKLSKNEVIFSWNPKMKEDLVGLKTKYTQYLANDYLKLTSQYSQNLYEQMKSYQNIPTYPQVTFTINDLHRIMGTNKVKSYKSFNDFKNKCLLRAINDINTYTDINVVMTTKQDPNDKRKTVACAFSIYQKTEPGKERIYKKRGPKPKADQKGPTKEEIQALFDEIKSIEKA